MRIVKVFWGLDASLAYARHFPAINWLTSYSLYLDTLKGWCDENVWADWFMQNRGRSHGAAAEGSRAAGDRQAGRSWTRCPRRTA